MNSKRLKQFTVLLVEDEKKLASLLKDAVGNYFYDFETAQNGEEGIEKFLLLKPDIVITDITMPKMTGLQMASKIKEINENIPIIILSAFSDTDKLINAIDVGVVKYFIKPFDPDELLEYIDKLTLQMQSKIIQLYGGYSFNKATASLYKDQKYIHLSKKERLFIGLLLEADTNDSWQSKIITNKFIKNTLWGNQEITDAGIRAFIKRLRAKTSKNLIKNIKGKGYKIELN